MFLIVNNLVRSNAAQERRFVGQLLVVLSAACHTSERSTDAGGRDPVDMNAPSSAGAKVT